MARLWASIRTHPAPPLDGVVIEHLSDVSLLPYLLVNIRSFGSTTIQA